MDPTTVFTVNLVEGDATARKFRQLVFYPPGPSSEGADDTLHLVALGAVGGDDGHDAIYVLTVANGSVTERKEFSAPSPNGRLVFAEQGIVWQAEDGEVYSGMFTLPRERYVPP